MTAALDSSSQPPQDNSVQSGPGAGISRDRAPGSRLASIRRLDTGMHQNDTPDGTRSNKTEGDQDTIMRKGAVPAPHYSGTPAAAEDPEWLGAR